jgi:hypothetical protein
MNEREQARRCATLGSGGVCHALGGGGGAVGAGAGVRSANEMNGISEHTSQDPYLLCRPYLLHGLQVGGGHALGGGGLVADSSAGVGVTGGGGGHALGGGAVRPLSGRTQHVYPSGYT